MNGMKISLMGYIIGEFLKKKTTKIYFGGSLYALINKYFAKLSIDQLWILLFTAMKHNK
jgi:hypothetical protein